MTVIERLSRFFYSLPKLNGKTGLKKLIQIFFLVLGSILAAVMGGFLIAITLIASPLITVLILLFLIGYGLVVVFSK